MILAGIVALFLVVGAFTRRRRLGYWAWGIAALIWVAYVGPLLFLADGTLYNPVGDGLITRQVRLATNEGPWMAPYVIFAIIALYGGMIWLLRVALTHSER